MAKGINTKKLDIWKEKLYVAGNKFDAEIKDNLKLWRDYYKGKQWGHHDKSGNNISGFRDESIDNMVFQIISVIIPSLIIKNPTIYASARKRPWQTKNNGIFDTSAAARNFEILMNYIYEKIKLKRQSKKCLTDALIGPWGLMQLGFTTKLEKVKDGKELISNEIIKSESVFATRISPNSLRIDSKATDHLLEDAEWIAFKWEKSLEDVKDNPNFSNTENLKSNKTIDTSFGNKGTDDYYDETKDVKGIWESVEGWTIWDKKNQEIIDIVMEHDKELRFQPKWPWKIDGFPLEVLYFNEKPDELVPLSDTETYIDKQDELNLMGSIQLDTVRRHGEQKWVVRAGAFKNIDDELKLTHGGSGVIVPVAGDPSTAIFPIKNNTLSQDVLITKRSTKNDIRESQKIGGFESGIAEKFDTATEALLIQQGVSIQRENRRDIMEDHTLRVINKLSIILQQTLDTEVSISITKDQAENINRSLPDKIEKIVGTDGEKLVQWLTLSKDDIVGDYEFKLELGSMQPINKETRKRDILELVKVLTQAGRLPDEVLKRIFEAFEEKDYEKIIESMRRQQGQQQQAASQAAEKEIQQESQKKQIDLQKTQMKTQTTEKVAAGKNQTAQMIALINNLGARGGSK